MVKLDPNVPIIKDQSEALYIFQCSWGTYFSNTTRKIEMDDQDSIDGIQD